jgi:hypothetical protein
MGQGRAVFPYYVRKHKSQKAGSLPRILILLAISQEKFTFCQFQLLHFHGEGLGRVVLLRPEEGIFHNPSPKAKQYLQR